jgi:hypothetical protein
MKHMIHELQVIPPVRTELKCGACPILNSVQIPLNINGDETCGRELRAGIHGNELHAVKPLQKVIIFTSFDHERSFYNQCKISGIKYDIEIQISDLTSCIIHLQISLLVLCSILCAEVPCCIAI